MRHHNRNIKLKRVRNQRQALLKTLSNSLIARGRIETSHTKARALKPYIERLTTIAKKGDLASRRVLIARLGNEKAVQKLMEESIHKYKDRKGGYTRIIKKGSRPGDGSPRAFIEFV